MNDLAKVEEMEPVSQSDALISIIERIAVNPDADIDKMDRLLQMKERLDAKDAEQRFSASMVEAQAEMGRVSADATNPQTRSQYASYAALDRALRPIFTKHGFSLSFDTADSPKDLHVRVLCYVAHSGGHSRTHHVDMPADGLGAKGNAVMTKTHAAGSAMQYGMRYLLKLIFNVAVGEDDDDGNGAGNNADTISEEQATEIHARLTEHEIMPGFMKWLAGPPMKCYSIEEIRADAFDIVSRRIDSAIRSQEKQ